MLCVGFGFVSDAEAGLERDVQNIVDSRSQYGLAWPAHPAITQIQRSMADALNMAMSGALEPQEAAEVDEILLEY